MKANGGIRMSKLLAGGALLRNRFLKMGSLAALCVLASAGSAWSQESGGEASLKLPDLSELSVLGTNGHTLLVWGLLFCVFGLVFGMTIFIRLKNLPVHRSMRDI